MRFHFVVSFVALTLWISGAVIARESDGQAVAFSLKLASNDDLVVVQEPLRPIAAIAGLGYPELSRGKIGVYSIRLELRHGAAPPLTLWSRLAFEPAEEAWRGFRVLALRPESDCVVLATAESFSINLWKLSLVDGTISHTILDSANWSLSAAVLSPINTDARVKIDRSATGRGGRLRIIVTEPWPDNPNVTTFTQAENNWEFKKEKK